MRLYLQYSGAFLFGLFVMSSCSPKVTGPMFSETPPNGVLVKENFYCDQTEMTNFAWMEYMFSVGRTYGKQSPEHLATYPDTSVWAKVDTNYKSYPEYYLAHPAYRDYPALGISQQQARDYSVWRSDRVFEFLLIREEIIPRDTLHTIETEFTIEKYFSGNYLGMVPDTLIEYYPEFRLPTIDERAIILVYADSVKEEYLSNCHGKKCKECNEYEYWSLLNVVPKKGDGMIPVDARCIPYKFDPVLHLIGNAGEWVFEDGILAGGAWEDVVSDIQIEESKDITIQLNGPTRTSGFRNVFQWKSVKTLNLD